MFNKNYFILLNYLNNKKYFLFWDLIIKIDSNSRLKYFILLRRHRNFLELLDFYPHEKYFLINRYIFDKHIFNFIICIFLYYKIKNFSVLHKNFPFYYNHIVFNINYFSP